MKSFRKFMEGFGKPKEKEGEDGDKEKKEKGTELEWKDVKNRDIKKAAEKEKKKLKGKEVLAYSQEHGEFFTFKDDMELIAAKKGKKGKAMKWIKVESWLQEATSYKPGKFNFKAAVKLGMLEKEDEKYFKEIEKGGWNVFEFNLTSKGFEIVINKGSRKQMFTGKNPEDALKQAAQKAK